MDNTNNNNLSIENIQLKFQQQQQQNILEPIQKDKSCHCNLAGSPASY